MKKGYQLIFILLIIQPIIDLITSFMTKYFDGIISIGALLRTFLLGWLFIYTLQYVFTKKFKIRWMIIGSYGCIFLMALLNFTFKNPYLLFEELNFILKTAYYVVMIYIVIILIDKQLPSKELIFQATNIIALIIGSSYWLVILTNTGINSYTYGESGYSGWFYSANELSVIVIILLGLIVAQLSHQGIPTAWFAFTLILSMLPMIGTKTAFYGGLFIIILFSLYLLMTYHVNLFRDKRNLLFFSIITIYLILTPFSPIFTNTQQLDLGIKQTKEPIIEHVEPQDNTVTTKLLSSRNIYLQDIKEDYMHAEVLRKVFGLGYAGDYQTEPKLIEMDFFDLFFSYGLFGTLFLLTPLLYLVIGLITFPIHMNQFILWFTLCLCAGISFLAGHVIFAPSVMTYIAMLLLAIGLDHSSQSGGDKYAR